MKKENFFKENINIITNITVAVAAVISIFITVHYAKKQLDTSIEVAAKQMQQTDVMAKNQLIRDSINSISEVKIKDSELELVEDQLEYSKALYNTQRRILEQELRLMDERNKMLNTELELAEANRRSSYTYMLSEVMKNIREELNNFNNKEKILSENLRNQIVACSKNFKPYKYLNNSKLTSDMLSPERGQLLTLLLDSKIQENSLRWILLNSDFTYADLTNMKIQNAKIFYTNLYKANFSNSTLSNIDFSHSIFEETIMENTFFIGTINFSSAVFDKVKFKKVKAFNLLTSSNSVSYDRETETSFYHEPPKNFNFSLSNKDWNTTDTILKTQFIFDNALVDNSNWFRFFDKLFSKNLLEYEFKYLTFKTNSNLYRAVPSSSVKIIFEDNK